MAEKKSAAKNQVRDIQAFAEQFPTLFTVRKTAEGLEITSNDRMNRTTVFFFNDGTACRTDVKAPRVGVWEGARILGMTG